MNKKLTWRLVSALLACFLAACGGGDGGGSNSPAASSSPPAVVSTLGGVAAVGSPIVAGTINVTCAAGDTLAPTATSSMGAWQVPLSGQTLPCAIQVSGGIINNVTNNTPYHSIAVAAGTVNVTPLTDLVVANLAGTATPSAWFSKLKTAPIALTSVTQAKINNAFSNLTIALDGLNPLSKNNPITTAFTPTSGNVFDDMLSALKSAMTNTSVTYSSLLTIMSSETVIPISGFSTALTTAYAGTTSGSIITSAAAFTIGGTISGLTGSVILQNNHGDNLTVSANGNFTFATQLANVSPYSVTAFTQPTGQTCTVSTGSGTVYGGNVSNVVVVCSTNTNSVGGTVSGLKGNLVLQDNNGDNLSVSANGTFTFSTKVAYGSPYSVTVLSHPESQSCSVADGTGTISLTNISNVTVTCAINTFTIGGTVTGLSGSIALKDNNADNLSITANGRFTFPTTVAHGSPYAVTISAQPAGQSCTVTGSSFGSNKIATANITNVVVNCTTTGLPSGYLVQGGLTWTPNTIGGWDGRGCTQWDTANTYCTTSTINGQTNWRLPTRDELVSLSNSGAASGAQGWVLNSPTWSSTPDGAGIHDFVDMQGSYGWSGDNGYGFVSCVH